MLGACRGAASASPQFPSCVLFPDGDAHVPPQDDQTQRELRRRLSEHP